MHAPPPSLMGQAWVGATLPTFFQSTGALPHMTRCMALLTWRIAQHDPLHGPTDPLHGPTDPLHGPIDPLHGPTDPLHGPTDPLHGPIDPAAWPY
jgi:hypothetical protein